MRFWFDVWYRAGSETDVEDVVQKFDEQMIQMDEEFHSETDLYVEGAKTGPFCHTYYTRTSEREYWPSLFFSESKGR